MEFSSATRALVRRQFMSTYALPGYLIGLYALLLLALGWFAHQRWVERASTTPHAASVTVHPTSPPPGETSTATGEALKAMPSANTAPDSPPAAPTITVVAVATKKEKPSPIHDGQVPALRYSAHVFTSDPKKRSITLNGVRYQEGDSPIEGLMIEQIEQDVTLFDVNGEVFVLDALMDWPGGDIKEAGNE